MTDQQKPMPWERQPKETRQAFEAFCVYRDMEPKRTLKLTAAFLKKSYSLMCKWSSHWGWQERVAEWYAEKDRVAREAQLDEIEKMNRRHSNVAQRMQKLVIDRFNSLTAEDVSATNLPKYVETAIKVERQAAGVADEVKVQFAIEKELEAFLRLLESELEPEIYERILRVVAEAGIEAATANREGESDS